MNVFSAGNLLIASFTLILAGCGTMTIPHLNDPARSKPGLDVANLLPPRDIPYETQEKKGISVSYNLFHVEGDNLAGYRLTLILRNTGTSRRMIEPNISMQDAGGFMVPPYFYESFVSEAASLAGTSVPPMPASNQPTNYYQSGTVRNTTSGNTYSYSGNTTSRPTDNFASGFARGMAQGAAIRAANDREEGRLMLRWANSFWLRSAYELAPGAAATGALFFPATTVGLLPLRLVVDVGGEKFEFVSVAKQ